MERHQVVARVWNWLPAFRAVAEYEGLQRAALALSVSPSALSRSVSLLEETIGATLFLRSATGLILTDAGRRLLHSTRDAMRQVHEALPSADEPAVLRVGAVGSALRTVLSLEAVEALDEARLVLEEVAPAEVGERLRRGEVDVVLSHEPVSQQGVRCEPLPSIAWVLAAPPTGEPSGVVCLGGAGLEWPAAKATLSEVSQLPFVAERLGAAMFGPAFVMPRSWRVVERHSARPVQWVDREPLAAPSPLRTSLKTRLIARLTSAQSSGD